MCTFKSNFEIIVFKSEIFRSSNNIAGILNQGKNVLGMMPHPENHVYGTQHPQAHRQGGGQLGLALFESGIRYAAQL